MPILILDIETDGLEPRLDSIVEIGAVLLDTTTFTITTVMDKIIKEKKAELQEGAWIFGHSTLTYKDVLEKGVDLDSIREEFQKLLDQYPTIAYNGPKFDFMFLKAKGFTIKKPAPDPMFIMTDVLKIRGPRGYKWPTVQECLNHFGIKEQEPHRACGDAFLEARIVAEMVKLGYYDLNSSIFQAIQSENKDESNLVRYKAKIEFYMELIQLMEKLQSKTTSEISQKAVIESKEHLMKVINEKRDFCQKKIIELEKKPDLEPTSIISN
jgi:DNA polymerase III epsilon subunit-like protein